MDNIDWKAIGSIATAFAVLIAAWQLCRGVLRDRTEFEDNLSREYRGLSSRIPVSVFFGEDLRENEFGGVLPILYQYIDLTNEQVFLRMNGRVSKATWTSWQDGIKSNLTLPAFKKAWEHVKKRTKSFEELRKLEASNFSTDPRKWLPIWRRLLHCQPFQKY